MLQHVDTGELLMQAFADRAAVSETLQTGLATFYSRSRSGRWCKGETSGHFIKVGSVFPDCDRDSLVYLGEPIGPACHTVSPPLRFSHRLFIVCATLRNSPLVLLADRNRRYLIVCIHGHGLQLQEVVSLVVVIISCYDAQLHTIP